MRPTLLSTCRVLFKLSKSDENDTLFNELGITQSLLRLISTDEWKRSPDPDSTLESSTTVLDVYPYDVLIYAIGTLKNVSQAADSQQQLVKSGAVAALASQLRLPPNRRPSSSVHSVSSTRDRSTSARKVPSTAINVSSRLREGFVCLLYIYK